jgi:2-hydroxymuconate-semialdehyde hydrolase
VTEDAKRRVRTSAGEIAFVEAGDAEDPAVLLVHGFPTSSFLWRNIAPLLSPWMRVLAPDLLGCGDSDKPADAPVGIVAQTGYLRELLDALDVRDVAVVGHGVGGGIAQLLAIEGGVRTLVLLDSIAFDTWPSDVTREAQAQAEASASVPGGPSDAVTTAMVRTAFDLGLGHRERLNEDDLAEYVRPWAGPEGAAACLRFLRSMDGRGLEDTQAALEALEVPAFLVWGEEDPFVPVHVAERLADALPMSTLAVLPGCRHFLPEDAAETIAPLLFEYLRSRYLGTPHGHAVGGPVALELGLRPPEEDR